MVVKVKDKFEKTRQIKNNGRFQKVFFTRAKKCKIS